MLSNAEKSRRYRVRHRNKLALARENCRQELRQQNKNWRLGLRKEFIIAYGGKCVCCGESHHDMLTIEHKLGDGAKDRKQWQGRGDNLLVRLRRQGWPKDRITLLCWNCNRATRDQPVCPHGNYRR